MACSRILKNYQTRSPIMLVITGTLTRSACGVAVLDCLNWAFRNTLKNLAKQETRYVFSKLSFVIFLLIPWPSQVRNWVNSFLKPHPIRLCTEFVMGNDTSNDKYRFFIAIEKYCSYINHGNTPTPVTSQYMDGCAIILPCTRTYLYWTICTDWEPGIHAVSQWPPVTRRWLHT